MQQNTIKYSANQIADIVLLLQAEPVSVAARFSGLEAPLFDNHHARLACLRLVEEASEVSCMSDTDPTPTPLFFFFFRQKPRKHMHIHMQDP